MATQQPLDAQSATATKPRYAVPALEKGLAILELLASKGDGYTQTQIARQLGRSLGEIFRIMNCLERHEYISRAAGDERYRLTSKLFELAHAHAPTARLIDAAMPIMRALAERVQLSCHLVVHQMRQAVVIAQVDSPDSVTVSVRTGRTFALHESASGQVLAAFSAEDVQGPWLEKLKSTLSARRYRTLRSTLQRIHDEGHLASQSVVISDITDLSVPVLSHEGVAVAALTVPYLARPNRPGLQRVLKHLHEAASEIARTQGRGHISET